LSCMLVGSLLRLVGARKRRRLRVAELSHGFLCTSCVIANTNHIPTNGHVTCFVGLSIRARAVIGGVTCMNTAVTHGALVMPLAVALTVQRGSECLCTVRLTFARIALVTICVSATPLVVCIADFVVNAKRTQRKRAKQRCEVQPAEGAAK
jgi:hypothetical protein